MSEKRAGGILASSFVAGLLLAAAIFSPRAWEPVPGPYFGLEDQTAAVPVTADGMEAAHAELSARAQSRTVTVASTPASTPVATTSETPLVAPAETILATDDRTSNPSLGASSAAEPAAETVAEVVAEVVAAPVVMAEPPAMQPAVQPAEQLAPPVVPPVDVTIPPQRVAMADPASPAAMAALAATLPPAPATPAVQAVQPEPRLQPSHVAEAPPASPSPQPFQEAEPPASLKAMMTRMQAAQPAIAQPAASVPSEQAVQPSQQPVPTPAPPQSWSQAFAAAPAVIPVRPQALSTDHDRSHDRSADGQPRTIAAPTTAGPLGVPPLPGEPWTDPDGVNWSDVIASPSSHEADRRRNWLGDWRNEPRNATSAVGGRLFDRLRGGDRRLAQAPAQEAGPSVGIDMAPPDISQWPQPVKLHQQLDHLATLSAAGGAGGEPIGIWTNRTRTALQGVQDTRGPRDAAADASLIALGETVIAGMSLADTTIDAGLATHTRRTALAVARRVAVWRSTSALFASLDRNPKELSANDAAAAMTRQAAGRTVVEIARLLDGIERFEVAMTAADAMAVKTAIGSICGFYPTASRPVARAVEDHYLAPNVRIAVHQQFLEKLLPGASVDTSPFQDTVMGREVRGTRTVERTTMLRLVPDDDEICFNLEVHGDIASRAVTESGPVSVTARSASAFTVRKPITISSQGLLFGNASGAASNRSHVDTIQTSFDAVPVMGSLVRNMARNQQMESMPEANREVIDKIISRACREVDTQAEPQFAQMADRIRDRVWMPLVRLGLDPKAVAMQTTSSVATMRLRLAGDTQLAAHTPRPRAPSDAMLSLQIHESSANNAFDRLGIAGKRLTLEELIELVCSQIGVEPRIPEELPEGVAVAFAKTQPLRVECRDGLVHVHVALDAIESGRRDWYDLIAHVAYRPVCSGQQVFLEREGPVQLGGPGHEGRMELALRTIFGKIFPKERPIAVLPEKIAKNEKLADVHAVQAVSSDGWLAITLEQRKAPPPVIAAPPKPQQARPAEARRKAVWR
jgi:hypothetical protein